MDILLTEKVQLEKNLETKQGELLEARRAFGDLGIKPGGQVVHPLVQRAIRLNEAMVEVQEKRLEMQSALAAIQGALRRGEDLKQHLLAVEEAVGREILLTGLGFNTRDAGVQANLERSLLEDQAELKTADKYLGPNHPRIAEITERIRATQQYMTDYQDRLTNRLNQLQDTQLGPMLLQMLSQALGKAWEQETALRNSFDQASREAVKLNGDLAQLEILEHDSKRLQGLYDVLVDRIANTDLRQERGDIWARVVKEPTALPRPVSPRLAVVAFVCLVGSLAIGCATVYVLDVLDDRFRSPEELRVRLGVPVLAMVRQLDVSGGSGFDGVQTHVAPDGVESEAFRTLRTALAFSPHETERIVVSSSEPGDGKTTVLVNLAVSSAQSGRRTLLIDADLRRPGLTSLLGLKGEEGLSGLLRGDQDVATTASQSIRKTPVPHLDVLTSGPRRPNPSELLAGPRFADLLAWAESNYDQVLIDSPPVLAASDAQIIGRSVDGVILVVHTEKNRRRVVVRAVDGFTSLGIRLVGVVVNRVRPRGVGDYGYGYGYGYVYEDRETDTQVPEMEQDSDAAQGEPADNRRVA
jgi:capsular exopolysaccharide synthesis family protein